MCCKKGSRERGESERKRNFNYKNKTFYYSIVHGIILLPILNCSSHSLPYCVTVPGPPARVVVVGCNTVIWQPPQTPNGNLSGYIIRVYPNGSEGQAHVVNKSADDFYHTFACADLPAGDNLLVQVTRTNMVVMMHTSQLVPASSYIGSWEDKDRSRRMEPTRATVQSVLAAPQLIKLNLLILILSSFTGDTCQCNTAPPPVNIISCPPPPSLPGCIWCRLCSTVCGYRP